MRNKVNSGCVVEYVLMGCGGAFVRNVGNKKYKKYKKYKESTLCRKAHLLEDKQIPSVRVFDEYVETALESVAMLSELNSDDITTTCDVVTITNSKEAFGRFDGPTVSGFVATPEHHEEDEQEIVEPKNDVIPIRRSTRTQHALDRMCLYVDVKEHELGSHNEPANYKVALSDHESDKCLEAMNVEMQSKKNNPSLGLS
ncbi:hypothetical protein Tco_0209237 [Tanacetum coccineum]